MRALLTHVGALSIRLAEETGGVVLVLVRLVRGLFPPKLHGPELSRSLLFFGEGSLPIVIGTAALAGVIMVLQGAIYVRQYGVENLVGWYTGFSTLREVGPLLIGLMFSGRVGAAHTSELATMRVTEQLDALKVLALDVYEILILPRTLSMMLGLAALVVLGDLVAMVAGAVAAKLLLGIEGRLFLQSVLERLGPGDFLLGVEKAIAMGAVVAVVSTHFGLTARGGSAGVGRAVNAQVVGSAVALFLVDYLMTSVWR